MFVLPQTPGAGHPAVFVWPLKRRAAGIRLPWLRANKARRPFGLAEPWSGSDAGLGVPLARVLQCQH